MPKDTTQPIRVVVVDDSATIRTLLTSILESTPGLQVIGMAGDGEEALRVVSRLRPDVVTMDVNMPRMNGLEATRRIMREVPTPIVIISSSMTHADVDLTFEAMQAGALSVVRTPSFENKESCNEVIRTIRTMASVPVIRHWGHGTRGLMLRGEGAQALARLATTPGTPPVSPSRTHHVQLIGIASSTGGPGTLAQVLRPLPANFSVPILIVQHITTGFAGGLAEWLNSQVSLKVEVAVHGTSPRPGTVLLAPDDYHMYINADGVIELSHDAPLHSLRPSANYLFTSMARYMGSRSAGVILTGMGDDGVDGLEKLHKAGAVVIAQDEPSCVVYGMPREAVQRNIVDWVLSPDQISGLLLQITQPQFRSGSASRRQSGGLSQ